MKAILPNNRIEEARNLDRSKERVNTRKAVVASNGELTAPVEVRWWMGRSNNASVVYCSVWVRCKDGSWSSGYGTAGGYGYHKESAAFAEALSSAGIELVDDEGRPTYIGGAGDREVDRAIEAITRAAGYRSKLFTLA